MSYILNTLKKFGLTNDDENSHYKKISSIDIGKRFYVPIEAFHLIIEPNQQGYEFLLFLDLDFEKCTLKPNEYNSIEVYVSGKNKYKILEKEAQKDDYFKKNGISEDLFKNLISKIPKQQQHQIVIQTQEDFKKRKDLFEKFLHKSFNKIAGRELSEEETNQILLSTGEFKAENVKGVDLNRMLTSLKNQLALQEPVVEKLFNSLSILDIASGDSPTNTGIVLYGPGGTGKSTIMKAIQKMFKEEFNSYIPLNQEGELLKTSEVKDTKFYGAYQDYFGPYFAESIREARKRGVPSLICIDEGDIFVEKPKDVKGHGPEVINFFKAHVGNHNEFITIIATNVPKDNLDKTATRAGRIDTVEIPLPDMEIAMKLIPIFLKSNNIQFDNEITRDEIKQLANILVKKKLPGANVAYFCKNYHKTSLNVTKLIEEGYSTEKILQLKKDASNKIIQKKIFMERYEKEIENSTDEEADFSKIDEGIIKKIEQTEHNNFFQILLFQNNALFRDILEQFHLSMLIKDFYLSKKSEILSNIEESKQNVAYDHLVFLIQNLPSLCNSEEYIVKVSQIAKDIKIFTNLLSVVLNKSIGKITSFNDLKILFENELTNSSNASEKDITPKEEDKIIPNSNESNISQKIEAAFDYISKNKGLLEKIYQGNINGDTKIQVINIYLTKLDIINNNIEDYDKENNIKRELLFNYKKEIHEKIDSLISILNLMNTKAQFNEQQYKALLSFLEDIINLNSNK